MVYLSIQKLRPHLTSQRFGPVRAHVHVAALRSWTRVHRVQYLTLLGYLGHRFETSEIQQKYWTRSRNTGQILGTLALAGWKKLRKTKGRQLDYWLRLSNLGNLQRHSMNYPAWILSLFIRGNNHSQSDLLQVHFIPYELASTSVHYMASWTWTFNKSNWSVTIKVWQWPQKKSRVKNSKNSRYLLLHYMVFSQKIPMDSSDSPRVPIQGHLHSWQHSFRKLSSSWQHLLIICQHLLLNLWTLMTQKMLSQTGIPSCKALQRSMMKPLREQYRHLPLFIHLHKIHQHHLQLHRMLKIQHLVALRTA